MLLLLAILLFVVGCSKNGTSIEGPNTSPINYQPNKDRDQMEKDPEIDYSYYEQSKRRMGEFKQKNPQNMDEDIYTSEETNRVADHLLKQSNIVNAQVASTNDRIIVAVKLSDYGDREVGNEIEQEVRTIVPNKEIVVYTDYTYWEHEKDKMASDGASEISENVDDFLENFFNIDIKK